MAPRGVDELTRKAIQRAYQSGEGTYPELATRFSVSESTIKRICNGLSKASRKPVVQAAQSVVVDAIAAGASVTVGGIDINQYLSDGIAEMVADMKGARVATKEGMAGAVLRWMQYYTDLNPPTLEQAIENLLDRPDFDPQVFRDVLNRHAQKAG
jgi:hypothetical protein